MSRPWICDSEALMDDDSAQMEVIVFAAFWYLSRRSLMFFAAWRTQLVMLILAGVSFPSYLSDRTDP